MLLLRLLVRLNVGILATLLGLKYRSARWLSHYLLGDGRPLYVSMSVDEAKEKTRHTVITESSPPDGFLVAFEGDLWYMVGSMTVVDHGDYWYGVDDYDWNPSCSVDIPCPWPVCRTMIALRELLFRKYLKGHPHRKRAWRLFNKLTAFYEHGDGRLRGGSSMTVHDNMWIWIGGKPFQTHVMVYKKPWNEVWGRGEGIEAAEFNDYEPYDGA